MKNPSSNSQVPLMNGKAVKSFFYYATFVLNPSVAIVRNVAIERIYYLTGNKKKIRKRKIAV